MSINPTDTIQSTSMTLKFPKQLLRRHRWLTNKTRFYHVGERIGNGAFGTAYHGYPCDSKGKAIRGAEGLKLVVKFPNIQFEGRSVEEIRSRLHYSNTKNMQDFFHIGARLEGSKYATPLIDIIPFPDEDQFDAQATVQLFVNDAYDLDDWLCRSGLTRQPIERDPKDRLITNEQDFRGIKDRSVWVNTALAIGRGIADLHRRRVTHADIHPGNVFLSLNDPEAVTFIDFGEAFVATPDTRHRKRNPNAYLAPERLGPRTLLAEQVDVYSFGILILYLATGIEMRMPPDQTPGDYKNIVFQQVRKRNASLVGRDEPRILDVIARSIARDPADRPRMIDLCEALEEISATLSPGSRRIGRATRETLKAIGDELERGRKMHNSVLIRLLEQQIRELATTFEGLKSEMVELTGTRDQMLRAMTSLFDGLQEGDSWSASTTLAIWQRSALGLDGSYASANIRAIQRGASIRRVFVVSVEELGLDFCERLSSLSERSREGALKRFGQLMRLAVAEYKSAQEASHYKAPEKKVVDWHRNRFVYLARFLRDCISNWDLNNYFCEDSTIEIEKSRGLVFCVHPVSTLDKAGEVREANPASLVHLSCEKDENRRWLLVTTEARGRKASRWEIERPHLLGVRVFRSVQTAQDGRPHDRIVHLQRLLNNSANITRVTKNFYELIVNADSAIAKGENKSKGTHR